LTELYERHAALYDLAFRWDIEAEVDWLLERLGPGCRSILEPGCGSGRVLEPLARRGLEAVGIDRSPAMVELARARRGAAAEVVLADMTDFASAAPSTAPSARSTRLRTSRRAGSPGTSSGWAGTSGRARATSSSSSSAARRTRRSGRRTGCA
jgi:hypothetical protein